MYLFRHSVGLLGQGDNPDARPLPTQNNTTQQNADAHPCLEWIRTHDPSVREAEDKYVPQTARSLGPGVINPHYLYMDER
jgi:hypothetical protein